MFCELQLDMRKKMKSPGDAAMLGLEVEVAGPPTRPFYPLPWAQVQSRPYVSSAPASA